MFVSHVTEYKETFKASFKVFQIEVVLTIHRLDLLQYMRALFHSLHKDTILTYLPAWILKVNFKSLPVMDVYSYFFYLQFLALGYLFYIYFSPP